MSTFLFTDLVNSAELLQRVGDFLVVLERADHHATLSEHLRATVRTGTYCSYQPDPRRPVEWEIGT